MIRFSSAKLGLLFALALLISVFPFYLFFSILVLTAFAGAYFCLMPVTTLASAYALLPGGYLVLACVSLLFDIFRSLISRIETPWTRILIIESVAFILFLSQYSLSNTNNTVHLP